MSGSTDGEAVRTLEGFFQEIFGAKTSLLHTCFCLSPCLCGTRRQVRLLAGREEGADGPSLSTFLNLTERCHLSTQLWDDGCESVMPCFPPIITISSCNNNR